MYAYTVDGKHSQSETKPTVSDDDWWIEYVDTEDRHDYTDCNGIRYKSCTSFVASLDSPFAVVQAAMEAASSTKPKWKGLDTPEAVLARWTEQADAGTELHQAVQERVDTGTNTGNNIFFAPLIDQFTHWQMLCRNGSARSEMILWSRSLRIAGQADLVTVCDDGIWIDDIKTFAECTSDKEKKAAFQLILLCLMMNETFNCNAQVGGIILYEDYFKRRNKTVMRHVTIGAKAMETRRAEMQLAVYARQYKVRWQKEGEAMALNITSGVTNDPERVVIYGTEGVGKSTFASRFPEPVFIDAEGSTGRMDVSRFPKPKTWTDILQLLDDIEKEDSVPFKTLIVDTIDWVERLAAVAVARSKGKRNPSDVGFTKADIGASEEIKRVLDTLFDIQMKHKIHVVLTAHSWVKKFDPPDLAEGYDRYELKMNKHSSSLVREWGTMVLFANFASTTIKGDSKTKGVGDGTKRLLYTTKTDAWDAKNRHGLEPVVEFAYKNIAHAIEGNAATEEK